MKRLILLLTILLSALPVIAQSLDETYTFDVTGTQIDYPSDFDFELTDDLLIFSNDAQQIIVLDYPLVNVMLLETNETGLDYLVESIAQELLDDSIDTDAIYFFDIDGREVAAFDIVGYDVPGAVYAIEFSNGGRGILITINVSERTEDAMLESFDSFDDMVDDMTVSQTSVREHPSVYLFQSEARFIAPAEWSVEGRLSGALEYVRLNSPDEGLEVLLLDFSPLLTSGTKLEDVIEAAEVDWNNDFNVRFNDSEPEPYYIGDREAISYPINIRTIVDQFDGQLIVMRLGNDGIVAAIIFGEIDDYKLEIGQIVGSFNHLGATIDFMN